MGTYVKEYYPLLTNGNPLMSVLISQTFCESVYFEIRRENDEFCLYTNFEILSRKLLPLIKKYLVIQGIDGVSLKEFEMLAREASWREYIQPYTRTSRFVLDQEDKQFFDDFINKGLPELFHKPRWGLDGHSYEINVYGAEPRYYRCWCIVPKQWEIINEIVIRLSKYVTLGQNYYIDGVY